jgi:hypothetical protein
LFSRPVIGNLRKEKSLMQDDCRVFLDQQIADFLDLPLRIGEKIDPGNRIVLQPQKQIRNRLGIRRNRLAPGISRIVGLAYFGNIGIPNSKRVLEASKRKEEKAIGMQGLFVETDETIPAIANQVGKVKAVVVFTTDPFGFRKL